MTKEELIPIYLTKMKLDEHAILSIEEAVHIVQTNPPMPYFKYRADKLVPFLFRWTIGKDTCTGYELADRMAKEFLSLSRRAEREHKGDTKGIRELKRMYFE